MKFSYYLIKKLLPGVPAKTKLAEALNMHSFETEDAGGDVLEISLPPNRYADAASHIGVAREAAAVLGINFRSPAKIIVNPPSDKGFVDIDVRDAKLCPRYAARYFEFKTGIGPSPKWLKEVLVSCGLKPINHVVDIMNYVMLETGQPLHAFDADKLAAEGNRSRTRTITVRRARNGEKIKTLDGKKFILDKNILVIADREKPLALAGIKGGVDSGVTEKTKRIIVEAANFEPALIYRAARRLNIRTDASLRFGHGLSPASVQIGIDRATEFLLKGKTWLLDSVDAYPKPVGDELIEFAPARYESVVGAAVDIKKAKKYFASLGFYVEPQKSGEERGAKKAARVVGRKLSVRIPSWRADIGGAEDLIEEVARLEGYNKLKARPPVVSLSPARQEDIVTLKDKIRSVLLNFRLDEVLNSSFFGEKEAAAARNGRYNDFCRRPLEVANPVSEDKKYLRTSLLPLLLKNAEDNSRFYDEVRIFEIGKIFGLLPPAGRREKLSLGVVLAAGKNPKFILELKGLADEFLRHLGIDDFVFVPSGDGLRVESDRKVLGIMKQVRLEKYWTAAIAEFDLEKMPGLTEEGKEFIPLKKFPAVLRDISVLVAADARIGEIVQEIQLANRKIIENVDLIDEYVNEKLGGRQSLTFRIIFQADDRTLTDAEVNGEMEKIASALKKKFAAEIR